MVRGGVRTAEGKGHEVVAVVRVRGWPAPPLAPHFRAEGVAQQPHIQCIEACMVIVRYRNVPGFLVPCAPPTHTQFDRRARPRAVCVARRSACRFACVSCTCTLFSLHTNCLRPLPTIGKYMTRRHPLPSFTALFIRVSTCLAHAVTTRSATSHTPRPRTSRCWRPADCRPQHGASSASLIRRSG